MLNQASYMLLLSRAWFMLVRASLLLVLSFVKAIWKYSVVEAHIEKMARAARKTAQISYICKTVENS